MEDNHILINRIKNSGLTRAQKKTLIQLLPFMTDEKKSQMLALIEKSNEVTRMKVDFDQKLGQINKAYLQKIKNKKRELIHYAQQQFQKQDESKSQEVLQELETQLDTI